MLLLNTSSALAGAAYIAGALASVLPGVAHQTRQAENNPVLEGWTADPNMVIFGKTYYIHPTSNGVDYHVYKSQNLIDWTRNEEPIITLDGQQGVGHVPWARNQAWAPTMIERDGRFFLYHSGNNTQTGQKNIGVAESDSPEGPFTAKATPIIDNTEPITAVDTIDPHAFRDPVSGTYFLYWGHGVCLHARLSDDMGSIVESTLGTFPALQDYSEAPFVFYRDGTYYMSYSIDLTWNEDYRVGYATSGSPTGPWESRGVILSKRLDQEIRGPGHHSVVNIPGTDEWYIAYHRFGIPDGDGTGRRQTCIDRMEFEDDGLIKVVVPTLEGVEAREIE